MLEQHQLRIGQVVHLNSGSPDLTIVGIKTPEVEVEWQGPDGTEKHSFPVVCLSPAN